MIPTFVIHYFIQFIIKRLYHNTKFSYVEESYVTLHAVHAHTKTYQILQDFSSDFYDCCDLKCLMIEGAFVKSSGKSCYVFFTIYLFEKHLKRIRHFSLYLIHVVLPQPLRVHPSALFFILFCRAQTRM